MRTAFPVTLKYSSRHFVIREMDEIVGVLRATVKLGVGKRLLKRGSVHDILLRCKDKYSNSKQNFMVSRFLSVNELQAYEG